MVRARNYDQDADARWQQRLELATGLTLVGLPWGLGGAHAVTNALVSLCLGIVCVLALWRNQTWLTVPRVILVLAGLGAVASLIQLVPVPVVWLEGVSPQRFDVLSVWPQGTWLPLSLAPIATAHGVTKSLLLLLAAMTTLAVFEPGRIREVWRWVAISGGAVVLAGVLHGIAGFSIPYGSFGVPRDTLLVTPFINPNHAAGYLGLCAFASVGAARNTSPRLSKLLAINGGACALGLLLTFSRGAWLAFALALSITLAMIFRSNKRLVVGIAVGWAAMVTLAFSRVNAWSGWILPTGPYGLSKLDVWRPAPEMIADHMWAGTGRAAFGAVFNRYQDVVARNVFEFAENQWLQLFVDWGIIAAGLYCLVLGVGAYVLWRAALRGPARCWICGGLLFLAVHAFVDFELELGSVIVAASALFASVVSPVSRITILSRFWLPAGVTVVATGCALFAAVFSLSRDTQRLAQTLGSEEDDKAITAILKRHPVDYVMPTVLAQHHLKRNDPKRAIVWLNRAMVFAPHAAEPHQLAGRALLALGRFEQAALEYRLACQIYPPQAPLIAAELYQRTHDAELTALLARPGDQHEDVRFAVLRFLLRQGHHAEVADFYAAHPPQDLREQRVWVSALLEGEAYRRAVEVSSRLIESGRTDPTLYLYKSRALRYLREHQDAEATVREGMARTGVSVPLLDVLSSILLEQGRFAEARVVSDDIRARSSSSEEKALAHSHRGRINERQGHFEKAYAEYRRAADLEPHHVSHWVMMVRTLVKSGDYTKAQKTYELAVNRYPDNAVLSDMKVLLERSAQ